MALGGFDVTSAPPVVTPQQPPAIAAISDKKPPLDAEPAEQPHTHTELNTDPIDSGVGSTINTSGGTLPSPFIPPDLPAPRIPARYVADQQVNLLASVLYVIPPAPFVPPDLPTPRLPPRYVADQQVNPLVGYTAPPAPGKENVSGTFSPP